MAACILWLTGACRLGMQTTSLVCSLLVAQQLLPQLVEPQPHHSLVDRVLQPAAAAVAAVAAAASACAGVTRPVEGHWGAGGQSLHDKGRLQVNYMVQNKQVWCPTPGRNDAAGPWITLDAMLICHLATSSSSASRQKCYHRTAAQQRLTCRAPHVGHAHLHGEQ